MSLYSQESSENVSHSNKLLASSSFSQYYKNVGRTHDSSVSQKRETFLNEHKKKHNALLDENRDLSELFEECEVLDDELDQEEMDLETEIPHKNKKRIKFKMTMSEWFTEVPEDLEDKWLVKFCPEGKRRLIVANKRITKSFNKFGHLTSQFFSNLPGGGKTKSYSTQSSGMTVLDCVFNKQTRSFFVLDMLVWNSTSFLDCEAQFRHCWVQSKLIDSPECFEAYGKDSFEFKVVLDYNANKEIIRSEMYNYDLKNNVPCEGLLFYHKEAPYTTGETPLITWLRPFMLPEMLHVDIPHIYEEKKPDYYINQRSYLKKKDDKRRKNAGTNKKREKGSNVQMDI